MTLETLRRRAAAVATFARSAPGRLRDVIVLGLEEWDRLAEVAGQSMTITPRPRPADPVRYGWCVDEDAPTPITLRGRCERCGSESVTVFGPPPGRPALHLDPRFLRGSRFAREVRP